MSSRIKNFKLNSPKVNSDYCVTTSSSNFYINQSMLSSDSKESKNHLHRSQLKCTCSHPKEKIIQKTQVKCTCKSHKANSITNNSTSYKTESRTSRFVKAKITQTHKKENFSSHKNNSRKVCICNKSENIMYTKKRVYSETKNNLHLFGQKVENLRILSSPPPELTMQNIPNLAIIQKPKPIRILIPIPDNEIAHTNKIEIDINGLHQVGAKKDMKEKFQTKKGKCSRIIRANITKVYSKEKSIKDESSSSDYDVLKKIKKYEGDFKYKNLVNHSLEIIRRESSKSKEKINIRTPNYSSANQEKLAQKNIFHFTNTYEGESKDLGSIEHSITERQFTSERISNSPDMIQIFTPSQKDFYNSKGGESISERNVHNHDSHTGKESLNFKTYQFESNEVEFNQKEEKYQKQNGSIEQHTETKENNNYEISLPSYEIEPNDNPNDKNDESMEKKENKKVGNVFGSETKENKSIAKHVIKYNEESEEEENEPSDNQIEDDIENELENESNNKEYEEAENIKDNSKEKKKLNSVIVSIKSSVRVKQKK